MKFFKEYVQVLLGDSVADETNFIKGFVAAMEVFGVSCPVPFDRKATGLLDPKLHIWVTGQIFDKAQDDEEELTAAEGTVAGLYEKGKLGTVLADVGRMLLEECGLINTGEHRPDNEGEEEVGQEATDTPDSAAVTNQQPAEQQEQFVSNGGALTEAAIAILLGEDKQEGEAGQQAEVTGDPEVERAEVVEDPEVEGIFYQHTRLFRTKDSETYITEKALDDLSPEQCREYRAYWVMVVTKDGKSAFYDYDRHPAEYLGMLKQMEAAKAAKMAKNK